LCSADGSRLISSPGELFCVGGGRACLPSPKTLFWHGARMSDSRGGAAPPAADGDFLSPAGHRRANPAFGPLIVNRYSLLVRPWPRPRPSYNWKLDKTWQLESVEKGKVSLFPHLRLFLVGAGRAKPAHHTKLSPGTGRAPRHPAKVRTRPPPRYDEVLQLSYRWTLDKTWQLERVGKG